MYIIVTCVRVVEARKEQDFFSFPLFRASSTSSLSYV
jgi:hypothetical protein